MKALMLQSKLVYRLGIGSALAAGSLALGVNCARLGQDRQVASSIPTVNASEEQAPPVAFMSAEQMVKTMISATGTEGLGELTDAADDLIMRTYDERSGALPSLQTLNQATGPTLISVANLAASVCAKAVDRDRATGEARRDDRLFFREMDFSRGLGNQSSDAVTSAFERLARNAWRRDVEAPELEAVVSFAQEFSVGTSATDPNITRLLAIALCTSALSSVDALTY